MKKLFFLLIFCPLSIFGQSPGVKPAQVGTGVAADSNKIMLMDGNGRGKLSTLAAALGQEMTWNVGGNNITATRFIGSTSNQAVGILTNNIERMRIAANGNIGIGTISPGAVFDVKSGSNYSDVPIRINNATSEIFQIRGNGSTYIGAQSGYNSYLSIKTIAGNGLTNLITLLDQSYVAHINTNGFGTSNPSFGIGANNFGSAFIIDNPTTNYLFYLKGSNIGVLTSYPQKTLDVNGDVRIATLQSGALNDSLITVNSVGDLRKQRISSVTGWIQSGNNQYSALSGNVGIGTSPSYKLHINGTSGTVGVGVTGLNSPSDVAYYVNGAVTGSVSIFDGNTNATNGVNFIAKNTNTSSSTADAHLLAQVGGANAGDPYIEYTVSGVQAWSTGVDNSDADKFKINSNSSPSVGSSYERIVIKTTGEVGIGVNNPSVKLEVAGKVKADSFRMTTGASSGYIATSDATGNFSWAATIADARLSSNVPFKNGTNTFSGLNTFSDILTTTYISGTDANFSNPISVGFASAGGHAMNRNASDVRYAMLNGQANTVAIGTTNNANTQLIRQGSVRVDLGSFQAVHTNASGAKFTTTTAIQPIFELSNTGNGSTNKVYLTNQIENQFDNFSNGDLVIDPYIGQLSMKVNDARKDIAFGQNAKQTHNCSFTDGSDSSFVSLTDTTRTLRVYKSSAITTTKVRINLPVEPQTNARITILCETDPTSIDIKASSGQTILSSISRFTTVGVGDVIECWFDSSSEGSVSGKWYVKKL